MCIYLGDQEGLTYLGQEHVFPAALGGMAKLPKGMVSDEANRYFSGLERQFLHNSLIFIERMLWGPGKRGKNRTGEAIVCVGQDKENNYRLSFTAFGQPTFIPQIVVDQNKSEKIVLVFPDEKKDYNEQKEFFVQQLRAYKGYYDYIPIETDGVAIVGAHAGKIYICRKYDINNESAGIIINNTIDQLEKTTIISSRCNDTQVKQHYTLAENANTAKVCAKIAINTLAYVRNDNPHLIKSKSLDAIKNWVMSESKEYTLPSIVNDKKGIFAFVPDASHWCMLHNISGRLVAEVSIYNTYTRCFDLGETPDGWGTCPQGFICDWKNKKEYTLIEYITMKCLSECQNPMTYCQ